MPESAERKNRSMSAVVCGLAVLMAVALVHPAGEIPLGDEITYVHTARTLAQTGHVTYTGFISAMGGWLFYWGAVVVRLIGPSYLALRWSMALVAAVTALLLHGCMVRAGVRPVPAVAGTLTFCLSPLFLSKATTFLTDVPGVLAVVVCLYGCLRAMEAERTRTVVAWLALATLGNAVLGSARQYAWLGGLVMMPCAVWLLRGRRRVVVAGAWLWLVGVGMDCAMQLWFLRQPYIDSEPTLLLGVTRRRVEIMGLEGLGAVLEIGLLLLPALLLLVPGLWRQRWGRGRIIAVGVCGLGVLGLCGIHALSVLKKPYVGESLRWPVSAGVTVVLALGVGSGLLALITAGEDAGAQGAGRISRRGLAVLLGPFVLAYLMALVPRAYNGGVWDRYLLPVAMVALVWILHGYQERMRPQGVLLALSLGGAAYSTALLHDDFAYERARLAALNELAGRGVLRTSVTGGWAYDIETELQIRPFVTPDGVRLPAGVAMPKATHYGIADCRGFECMMVSDVVPKYAVTEDAGRVLRGFAPVRYRGWVTAPGAFYVTPFP